MSAFTLLPANKVENSSQILLAGFFMAVIGIGYITFEDSIIQQLPGRDKGEKATEKPLVSRAVFGTQIGLVLLSLVVTRSAINSIAAREGLPLGTQIVGWLTFSMFTSPIICSGSLELTCGY